MSFDKFDDVIDSRQIIKRHAELQSIEERTDDEHEEMLILEDLIEDASGSPDWKYGETLVRDSYFVRYAQELAEDCGLVPAELSWPCRCIDWKQAASELKMDYFPVKFDGVTFWIRG